MPREFRFEMNDVVRLEFANASPKGIPYETGEFGNVVARTQYRDAENKYLVIYVTSDGRMVESWWRESALALEFRYQANRPPLDDQGEDGGNYPRAA